MDRVAKGIHAIIDYHNSIDQRRRDQIDMGFDPLIPKNAFNPNPIDPWDRIKKQRKKYWDPIILDLNNDGKLDTTDVSNGIYIDYANDGFAESSAWVGNNDGVLVIDNNSNEKIDNGTELLTAETLASFNTNEDGIIDENDTNFSNLKILKGDGSLMTLTEAGITSINLNTTSTEITDENGNQQFASGTFTRADGTTGTFGEFLVKTETSNSIATEWLEETDGIAELVA